MKKFTFFTEEDDKVFFNGEYMEIYIPEYYFKKDIARIRSDKLSTIGLFYFKVAKDENDKGEMFNLKLPVDISIDFSSSFKDKLTIKSEDDEKYRIFQLYKGDIFLNSVDVEESATSTENFVKLLHGGKLSKTIPYGEIIDLYHSNLDINDVNVGVPSMILEFIVAELQRDGENLERPFRRTIGKDNAKVSEYDYETVSLKSLANLNSQFTDITFEDMNQAIISSINKTRTDAEENDSPVEKTLKY